MINVLPSHLQNWKPPPDFTLPVNSDKLEELAYQTIGRSAGGLYMPGHGGLCSRIDSGCPIKLFAAHYEGYTDECEITYILEYADAFYAVAAFNDTTESRYIAELLLRHNAIPHLKLPTKLKHFASTVADHLMQRLIIEGIL